MEKTINYASKEVVFLDFENTLIKTISGMAYPENASDFKIQLKLLDCIARALPNLKHIYVVGNKVEDEYEIDDYDYGSMLKAVTLFTEKYISHHGSLIYASKSSYCESSDRKWAKPNTGLLGECADELWGGVPKARMIMIGDESGGQEDFSDLDKKCAENYGIDYVDVNEFIERWS